MTEKALKYVVYIILPLFAGEVFMKRFSEIIRIASIFAGAVLGAGFAGGRELVTFFVRFGKDGVFASVIAGLLFLFLGAVILHRACTGSEGSYIGYLHCIFPKNAAYLINAISEVFLLVCFIIMLSGGGALFCERFGIPSFIGSLITALISFLVLSGGVKSLGTICSFLTPVMIIGILYVDICSLLTKTAPASLFSDGIKDNVIFSAVLYVSYNMLSCAPVLSSAASLTKNRRTALIGGIAGGIALTMAAFLSCLVLYLADSESLLAELPLLIISGKINAVSHTVYALVLYMAILTTAFSCGLPIVKKLESLSLSPAPSAFLLCALAVPLSFFKFSVLVEYCYTFFGYLGLLLIGAIVFDLFKNCKTEIFKENKSIRDLF